MELNYEQEKRAMLKILLAKREAVKRWKPGDKIIVIDDGYSNVCSLSFIPGSIFTFANIKNTGDWLDGDYLQVQELIDTGNNEHSVHITNFELFDPKKHEGVFATPDMMNDDVSRFVSQYGGVE